MKLNVLRQVSGLNQFQLAQRTGVSRTRISLFELGQLAATPEEENRIRRVLLRAIEARANQLYGVLTKERNGQGLDDGEGPGP